MSGKPTHHLRDDLHSRGDELLIGGIPVSRLAARIGRTPFYAYDRAQITARVEQLRAAMPPALKLHYAVKANPMPAVVQHLSRLVDGLDVASAGEMLIALDCTLPAAQLSFAGPGKTETEIGQAVAAGITLNIESEREIGIAASHGEATGYTPRLAVRVNPSFELKSSGMQMGGGPKAFGIDEERVPAAVAGIRARGMHFVGFHIYAGSQNLKASAVIEAQRRCVNLGLDLAQRCGGPLESLNIGGGLGIPYFPGELPLDLTAIGDALAATLEHERQRLADTEVVMELGRFLVGEAGYYVCRVLDRKISRGEVFLVTDGGLHHHLAASGNFGQVIRKNYPVLIATRMRSNATEKVDVVGPLCTPLDLLGKGMQLPVAEPGDLVAVLQSGAYGRSASPTAFLGHPAPAEVLV